MLHIVALLLARNPVKQFHDGPIPCGICGTLNMQSRSLKRKGYKESQIQDILLQECNVLNNYSRAACQVIVKDWFQVVMDESPRACKPICQNKSMVRIHKLDSAFAKFNKDKVIKPTPLGIIDCNICEVIVSFALEHGPGRTNDQVSEIFRQECKKLDLYKERCGVFTDEVVARTMEFITGSLHAFEICTFYGQC